MRRRTGPTPRAGYTLVELLVVIAIIATLVALTTAGVMRVRTVGQRTAAVNEINSLTIATTNFKNKFGFYPPNTFVAPTHYPPHPAGPFAAKQDAAYALLARMFRGWPAGGTGTPGTPLPASATITVNWPGMTAPVVLNTAGSPVVLDGNQCMVFFLAGPELTGFDIAGPTAPPGNNRHGPYYEDFQSSRLLKAGDFKANMGEPGNALPWYVDPWGSPYAYFAGGSGGYSGSIGNAASGAPLSMQFPLPRDPFYPSAPAGYTEKWNNTVATPYASDVQGTSPNFRVRWLNADSVQIISAGPNGDTDAALTEPKGFGPGSFVLPRPAAPASPYKVWKPGEVNSEYADGKSGSDDLGNFNAGTQLGSQGD